jgi:DNA-binding response OmpR family regulator
MIVTCPHCSRESEHIIDLREGDLVLELDTNWARRDRTAVHLSRMESAVVACLIRAGAAGLTLNELKPLIYRGEQRSYTALPMAVSRARDKLARLNAIIPKPDADSRNHRYRLIVNP